MPVRCSRCSPHDCRNSGKNSRDRTAGPRFLSVPPAKLIGFPLPSSMAPKRRRAEQRAPPPAPPPPLRIELSQRRPVVVFAHGAGAPSSSDWMTHWKEMVKDALNAIDVVTFDYPYMSGSKRRPPPKADKLVDHHLSVVKNAVAEHPGHPLVLMGKSMGSRGNRDGLCPLDKLAFTRKKMTCHNELHVVDGGDHSFKISQKYQKNAGVNQHDVEIEAVKAIAQFIENSVA